MHHTVSDLAHAAGPVLRKHGVDRRSGMGASSRTLAGRSRFLDEWHRVLRRLDASPSLIADLSRKPAARADILSALVSSGDYSRSEVIGALAGELGLRPAQDIDPERMVLNENQLLLLLRGNGGHLPVRYLEKGGGVCFLLPAGSIRPERMRACLAKRPHLAPRIRLVDDRALREALIARARPLLSRIAVSGLAERYPDMSAHVVANAWQGYMVGIVMTLLPVGLLLAPALVFGIVHLLATLFFLSCVMLRVAAAIYAKPPENVSPAPVPAGEVPTYSVLVALYKEADIVPDLLTALEWIVWPRERLEIKLVCEADDHETLAAIRACPLPPHVEVIEVPAVGPRTKPRALSYALPMTSGEFVVLYDAEDWPDPMQLAEAWARFQKAGPEVAVLQAPLEISNGPESPVARMFAFEYRALFRGLLPFLARHRFLLPLGGTSNHFRRAALEEVGGWDPYNVTEDADLGLRLARFGYRAETLKSPTYEKAPRILSVWVPQRTRWFKGWAQTWLVHMRQPLRLARDLGFGSFVMTQILFAGMLGSALLHPFLLAAFLLGAVRLSLGASSGVSYPMLMALDIVNVTCGYVAFLMLGWQTMVKGQRRGFWRIVLLTPVYWAMMSCAGWRAVWQLWRQPFRWEKTPHENMKASQILVRAPQGTGAAAAGYGTGQLWPMPAAATVLHR